MKKKILLMILTVCTLFLLLINSVLAAHYNGAGTAGAGHGSMPPNASPNLYYQYHVQHTEGEYVLKIIYSNGVDSNWEVIGRPLVLVTGNGDGYSDNGVLTHHQNLLRNYANGIGARLVYGSDDALARNVAKRIFNIEKGRGTSADLTEYLNNDDSKNAKTLFSYMGVDENQFIKEHNPATYDGSSYGLPGYRMVVEKVISVIKNGNVYGTTRKTLANSSSPATGDNCGFWLHCNPVGVYFGELHTEHNDINVATSSYSYDNFRNYNRGAGLHIYDLELFDHPSYDYSIDVVCEDCESTGTKGSLLLKDTEDFNAILNGSTIKNKDLSINVENYFGKGNGVYCREEYNLIFPNAKDQIEVASGRYFTINKQGGAMYDSRVPNYKTIKVIKKRECRAKLDGKVLQPDQVGCGPIISTGEQQSRQASKLNNFLANAKEKKPNGNDYTGKAGDISLKYKETFSDSKYNTSVDLEENKLRTVPTNKRDNSSAKYSAQICRWITETDADGNTTSRKVWVSQSFDSFYLDKSTSEQWYELSDEGAKALYRYVNKENNIGESKSQNKKIKKKRNTHLPTRYKTKA